MIADLGASAVLGFVLGPMVGLVCTVMNTSYMDQYSACGYLQAVFTIIMFIGSVFFFTEIPRNLRVNYMSVAEIEDDTFHMEQGSDETEEQFRMRKHSEEQRILLEKESLEKEEFENEEIVNNFVARGSDLHHITEKERNALEHSAPPVSGVMLCLWIFLIHFNGFAVQETITTPLVTDIKHVSEGWFNFDRNTRIPSIMSLRLHMYYSLVLECSRF